MRNHQLVSRLVPWRPPWPPYYAISDFHRTSVRLMLREGGVASLGPSAVDPTGDIAPHNRHRKPNKDIGDYPERGRYNQQHLERRSHLTLQIVASRPLTVLAVNPESTTNPALTSSIRRGRWVEGFILR